MEIIRELDSFKTTDAPVYLALGNFDGVHKGHQQLINKLVEKARLNEGTAAAFIFEPHPIQVLNPAQAPDLINTAAIKAQLLQQLGIDVLIYHSFTPQIAQCSPHQFINSRKFSFFPNIFYQVKPQSLSINVFIEIYNMSLH
jgi:riboflavin kinase/FMN adenylyltransferase